MANMSFSTGLAHAFLDAMANGGTTQSFWDSAILEVRTGNPPSDADQAPSGTLLASMTLPADAMNAAASHAITKLGTWSDSSADNTGTAGHFRIKKAGDSGALSTTDKRLDGDISATSGGGDMELDNTSINATQPVTVTTFTFSLPF